MPYCADCGTPVGDDQKFCRHCGAPQPLGAPVEQRLSQENAPQPTPPGADARLPNDPVPRQATPEGLPLDRSAAPTGSPEPPPPHSSSSGSLIGQLWEGRRSLPETFWVWGVLINVLLLVAFTAAWLSSPRLGDAVTVVNLVYYAFIVVAIFRSSNRYRGPRIWAALARIAVIVQVARIVLALLFKVPT